MITDIHAETIQKIIQTSPLEPIDDSIIIYRLKLTKTAGGIALPDVQDHKASRGHATAGVVIAAGPGRWIDNSQWGGSYKPLDVHPGEVILCAAMAGLELGEVVRKELATLSVGCSFEEIRLIRAHDVIAKLKNINYAEGQETNTEVVS